MVSIIVVSLLFGGMAAAGTRFLFRHVRQYLQWRRDTLMAPWKQRLLILPPMVLAFVVFGRPLLSVPAEYPVQRSELKEVTAPVEMVQEYESHQATGRSVRIEKRYRIYLEGYDGYLYIPDNFNFDQDAFLRWAGPEKVTFLYARTAGRPTVYQIQRENQVFLDYSQARERLMTTFLSDLLIWLAVLLFGLGGSVYLPEFLSPKERAKRGERILSLIFAAMLVAVIIITYGLIAQSAKITNTPAGSPGPLAVTVEEGVTLTLPWGWQEGAVGETGTQWYKALDNVSSCFRMAHYVGDSAGEDWYRAFLADFRARQLEEFIQTPATAIGPFLEGYVSSADRVPGTDSLVSEGWGASVNGYKDHFLLVLLPERDCAVVIQSSSKSLSWEDMENYVEEWIWPLLGGLEVESSAQFAYTICSGWNTSSKRSSVKNPSSTQACFREMFSR